MNDGEQSPNSPPVKRVAQIRQEQIADPERQLAEITVAMRKRDWITLVIFGVLVLAVAGFLYLANIALNTGAKTTLDYALPIGVGAFGLLQVVTPLARIPILLRVTCIPWVLVGMAILVGAGLGVNGMRHDMKHTEYGAVGVIGLGLLGLIFAGLACGVAWQNWRMANRLTAERAAASR